MKYLAVVKWFARRGQTEHHISKAHHTTEQCEAWIIEQLRDRGNENVVCYITEIKFCIYG